MVKRKTVPVSKSFRDIIETVTADHSTAGDISLASFLVTHGFPGREVSVGSIGAIPRGEALALNAMLSPQATFVVLTGDTLSQQREYLAEVVGQIESSGFPMRLQFADLTLPSRWPHILSAMARSEIGIVGIDARWAALDANFWTTLQEFTQTNHVLVYIRNLLDYHHAELALPFIRSMPADCTLDVVATTPSSVWFAADPDHGAATRQLLRGCGLFSQHSASLNGGAPKAPVVVTDESALNLTDAAGRLPRVVIGTNKDGGAALDYTIGWSDAEDDGCWTAGSDAAVRIVLPFHVDSLQTLSITGNSWIPPNAKDQAISIGIGSEPTTWTKTNFVDPEEILTTTLDVNDVKYDSSGLVIRFKVQAPGRPSDSGGSDTRLLGFKMRAISVFA